MRYDKIRIELIKILNQVSFADNYPSRVYGWGDYSKYSESVDKAVVALAGLDDKELFAIFETGKPLAERSADVAFQYFKSVHKAIKVLKPSSLNDWIELGLRKWDKHGIGEAKKFFSGLDEDHIREINKHGVEFHKIHRILRAFVDALGGTDFKVITDKMAYTDTKNLFVPSFVKVFNDRELNFKVYKIILLYEFAQIKYNSLDLALSKINHAYKGDFNENSGKEVIGSSLEKFLNGFLDNDQATAIFEIIENYRIERKLKYEYNGFLHEIKLFEEQFFYSRPNFSHLSKKEKILEALMQKLTYGRIKNGLNHGLNHIVSEIYELVSENIKSDSTPEDSARLTIEVYNILNEIFPSSNYRRLNRIFFKPSIIPEKVTTALKEAEKEFNARFKALIRKLNIPLSPEDEKNPSTAKCALLDEPAYYALKDNKIRQIFEEISKLLGNGKPGHISALKMLDILEDYLDYGGVIEGDYKLYIQKKYVYIYPEWDYNLKNYKNGWCRLKKVEVFDENGEFVDDTLKKYSSDVKLIKKQFEKLRPGYVKLFRQEWGEEVDLDAFIDVFVEIKGGLPVSEKVYFKINKGSRSIAVAFLLDMSASTSGDVLNSEKKSLIIMCEALNILGDKFAIFGLSSDSRHACNFYIIKDFNNDYDSRVKNKLGGLQASGFTRLGPAIRHLTTLFKKVESRIKLVILLTDCRPEDSDGYSGIYGAEDTRMALTEGRKHQINYFCIDIDSKTRKLASYIFGQGKFIIVEDVSQLAVKLPKIYRRLTT